MHAQCRSIGTIVYVQFFKCRSIFQCRFPCILHTVILYCVLCTVYYFPPTDCRRSVSGTVSLPSSGCFSPFPHGTGSLSVSKEYLAFGGGPPIFRQNFTCSALLNTSNPVSYTGLSPILLAFPDHSSHIHGSAGPRSLAATNGVSIDVLSSGYLDVSVPRVCFFNPIYSG